MKYGGRSLFCPKCGKENSDDNIFCIHCGNNVNKQENGSLISLGKSPRQLLSSRGFVIVSGIIVISIIFVLIYLSSIQENVEGRYIYTYSNSEDIFLDFTEEELGRYDGRYYGNLSIDDGYYNVNDDRLQLYNSDLDRKDSYIIYKNYLLDVDSKYKGKVPKGSHFNKPFESASSYGKSETYIFKADGTMSFNGQNLSGKHEQGTYERKGDLINYRLDNYDVDYTIVIYNDEIYGTGYYKN